MPANTAPVDNFDETIKDLAPKGFNAGHQVCFATVALIASAVPAYLFTSKFFSVSLSYFPVFIGVTLVCTILLTISYNKLASQEFGRVVLRKKTFSEEPDEAASRKEAVSYAMFITNLIFEVSVFLLSFVILPRINIDIPTYAVYVLVAGLSGALTFGFSYGLI
ncbi:hypothetical protein JH06_4657 [Blastocystis sp. subtype 4]|uniref:hypothetical protein n=1 Tax=Blastocystis sp. subtype 4 TaxID=944170 RepID=UPI0007115A24|nr:hypothetical protein JH06_4657 [Blastocystis sp. subtype 4]KNB45834.1 hypothetical protein JH06_4657 [Blastocystis sp. subtype 4]|eukprot:XP_014529272.1 hypothetical protein JH06_4657 [Blastocystis sp. subtype 4]